MTNPDQPDQPDRVEHRMERTYEVAATPEQVWDAIATADGISAWMVPTRLDPQIGGEVSFDLGEFMSTGVVTDYTPNHRFAYEEPWPIADRAETSRPRWSSGSTRSACRCRRCTATWRRSPRSRRSSSSSRRPAAVA